MASVNKVILIGNLGQDPEMKFLPNGNAICNFSIATKESWKGQDGTPNDKTEWHRIVVFGKLAEICGQYLKKGKQTYIEGKIQTRSWEDRDGNKRYTTEIVANQMTMLGSKADDAGSGGGTPYSPPAQNDESSQPSQSSAPQMDEDDDLPF